MHETPRREDVRERSAVAHDGRFVPMIQIHLPSFLETLLGNDNGTGNSFIRETITTVSVALSCRDRYREGLVDPPCRRRAPPDTATARARGP